MNITLIGGSGFVGTRLLGLLGEQPEKYTLRNIDKRQSHFFPHVTQLADVRDAEALREKSQDRTSWCCWLPNTATTCRPCRSTTT